MCGVTNPCIMLVSYPRSGSTWLRFMLGNLLFADGPTSFANVERRVADIYAASDAALLKLRSPRVLKSHEYYDPRYNRVLCLVRDPRDVALSYYRWHIKFARFDETYPIRDFVLRFLEGGWDRYGPWPENVGSWLGARAHADTFVLLRYESLLADPIIELSRVGDAIGQNPSPERLELAVALSSAKRMRELERTEGNNWKVLRHTRRDTPFVGAATVGQWRSALPVECAELISTRWGYRMAQLGYELE